MSKKLKIVSSALLIAGFSLASLVAGPVAAKTGARPAAGPKGTVAFLGPETFTGRWVKDAADFKAELHKLDPNIKILEYNANANLQQQTQQANAAEAAGAKVLIVAAVDQFGDVPIVNHAASKGLKVLAYDRMIQTPKLLAYDSFDNQGVGILQGTWFKANVPSGQIVEILGSATDHNEALFNAGFQKEVGPLVTSHKYTVCYSTTTPSWDPPTAGTEMSNAFTKCGKNIAGVYSMNDGMAADIYTQIKDNTSAKIPLTGQDAQPDGLGRILLHEQGMTVFKNVKFEADAAAQFAYSEIAKKGLPKEYKNGGKDCEQINTSLAYDGKFIKCALFVPEAITLHNVGDPVKAGFDTWATTSAGIGVCPSVGLTNTSPYCGLPH